MRDRRQFIRGQWIPQTASALTHEGETEIASILVQTRPERLDAAEQAILRIAGTEIYARDARGKLVVVVEAGGDDPVGNALVSISTLPDVVTATLVYHGIDSEAADEVTS